MFKDFNPLISDIVAIYKSFINWEPLFFAYTEQGLIAEKSAARFGQIVPDLQVDAAYQNYLVRRSLRVKTLSEKIYDVADRSMAIQIQSCEQAASAPSDIKQTMDFSLRCLGAAVINFLFAELSAEDAQTQFPFYHSNHNGTAGYARACGNVHVRAAVEFTDISTHWLKAASLDSVIFSDVLAKCPAQLLPLTLCHEKENPCPGDRYGRIISAIRRHENMTCQSVKSLAFTLL